MAEPVAGDDEDRQSPLLEEDEPYPSPHPSSSFVNEGETARILSTQRLPIQPFLGPTAVRQRIVYLEPPHPATPLLLNSDDLPSYSDLSSISSYRLDDTEHRVEDPPTINRPNNHTKRSKKIQVSGWRKAGYTCLFLVGILISITMLLIGMYSLTEKSTGSGSGQKPSKDWENSPGMYLLILGGLSLFFVIWHTTALLIGFCTAGRNCLVFCIHWFLRVCHFGAICLTAFIFCISRFLYRNVQPNPIDWNAMDAVLFLSIILACVMVAYCCIELVVDLCLQCYHCCKCGDSAPEDDDDDRN